MIEREAKDPTHSHTLELADGNGVLVRDGAVPREVRRARPRVFKQLVEGLVPVEGTRAV